MMFNLANLFRNLAIILNIAFNLFYFLLVARIISSWIAPDPFHQVVQIIYKLTDPILNLIKRLVPLQFGMIDFSPIIAFFLLEFLKNFIVGTLISISNKI
ncbi:YggT family protein [bacterium]|nr:YggT family protein [bacterium]MBU1782818.1 YggT family protein [bacterium]MBU2599703.1 YggT family protein [bacterium]